MSMGNPPLYDPIMPKQVNVHVLDSNDDMDDNEHYDEGSQLAELDGDEYEFGNTELEDLVLTKRP